MLSDLKALLADVKTEGGWLFPFFPPFYVGLLNAVLNTLLGEVYPSFVMGALLILAAALLGWSAWAIADDVCPTAAQALRDTPGYVIRPRQLLADIQREAQFRRELKARSWKLARIVAGAYLGSILIVLTVWVIAAYLVYLTIYAGGQAVAWIGELTPEGREGLLFFAGGVMVLALAVLFIMRGFAGDRDRQAKGIAEAEAALNKYPYLRKAKNAFRYGGWVEHHLTKQLNINSANDVIAAHEAIALSAMYERHKRGYALKDAAGNFILPSMDKDIGIVVETISHNDGSTSTIYATDIELCLSPEAMKNAKVRASGKGASYMLFGLDRNARLEAPTLGLRVYSERWLGQWVGYVENNECHYPLWKQVFEDDGIVPLFGVKLLEVREPGAGRTSTEKGSAEWEWPEGWAASGSVASAEEAWLAKLADRLRFYVEQATRHKVPACVFRWSARDPEGTGVKDGDTLGRCYAATNSQPARIWIKATQSDRAAAITLLHELIHAALPAGTAHGPEFVKVAAALGFVAPYTQAAFIGEWIDRELKTIGPIPRQKATAQAR